MGRKYSYFGVLGRLKEIRSFCFQSFCEVNQFRHQKKIWFEYQ